MELYAKPRQRNPKFKALYENYMAFKNDAYLWTQVADYTFDTFQIRQRAKGG